VCKVDHANQIARHLFAQIMRSYRACHN
jgi:hypothetical protein